MAPQLSVICIPEQAGRDSANTPFEKGTKLKTKNRHAVILLNAMETPLPDPIKEGGEGNMLDVERPLNDKFRIYKHGHLFMICIYYMANFSPTFCDKINATGQVKARVSQSAAVRATSNPLRLQALFSSAFAEFVLSNRSYRG
ncbi:hypothetical protein [Rahnella perminowiae]|uniref:hypothetical protein n=1 Tax=Rahnella perminowiae TaxID=2816244 RepID=UPI001EE61485|nr:hypothetical protein [Rahnella perminowiae]